MKLVQLLVFRDNTVSVSFLQRNLKRYTKNAKNNDIQEEMKKSKAVYVTKRKIRDDQNLVYHLYRSERERRGRSTHRTNFGSQYDSRRDSKICTCRKPGKMYHNEYYYSGLPKQIYACHGSRRYIDIGVGSIKTIQRKKVKRIYLPETDDTGVGSSDLSSFMFRGKYPKIINVSSYYGHKKTSSKCIGGIIEYNTGCVVNQKLSPIIQTKSDATSPKRSLVWKRNIETGSNTIDNRMETTETQFEIQEIEKQPTKIEKTEIESIVAVSHIEQQKQSIVATKPPTKVSVQTQKKKFSDENVESKKKVEPENKTKEVKNTERTYSSDSLVQHVHNLENPSDEKQSRISFPDTMENKLEREYRKMFLTTKSKQSCEKPIPEFKSASILRRRFEALKRGIIRKDDSNTKKKGSSLMKAVVKTSNTEVPTHKDASVTSDPPSLISVSFSDTEQYKQAQQETKTEKNKTMPQKKDKQGIHLSTESQPNSVNSEGQNVKGMFRLWGKKFNFEEDAYGKRQATPMPSYDKTKKKDTDKEEELKGEGREKENKKEGKKFFFFKKKSKDQPENTAYSPKKDVTAGRCEIRDGIVLKIGEAGPSKAKKSKSKNPDEGNEIIRKTWMKKFMSETMESARSVNIRWNNSLYATSSSTVFALLDSVYKNTDVILSKRDVTDESSYFKSFTKQVNFVHDIEAWMIPRTIIDRPIKQMPMRHMPLKTIPLCINSEKGVNKKKLDSTPSDQKWYIEKSEAFSHKIEVVLHSNKTTDISNKKTSSEYLRIDIPGDFFDTSSDESKQNHSSDEEVFKIVEYETNSEITKANNELHKCDNVSNDIKLIVSVKDSRSMESKILETVLKRPPINKSSIVQGNDENESQRCDVIGVGIITQRDLREIRKPVLKIREDTTERDDIEPFRKLKQKKCEFAESYLKEYYRHIPFGIDLCPWCVSDSHVCSSSEKSCASGYQGEGSKSCPNIYEDLKATIVTSCDTSSVPCKAYNYDELKKETTYNKIFKRFMRPSKAKTESELAKNQRSLPKDSIEVFKKRKINEMTARAEWARIANDVKDVTCSVPSVQSKCCSSTKIDVSLLRGSGILDASATDHGEEPIKKVINFKPSECDSCTSKNKGEKHAVLNPFLCEITQQPSRDVVFEIMATSSCNKPKTPSSNALMSSKTILEYNSSVNYQSPKDCSPAPLCVQACCEPSSEMPPRDKNALSKSPSPTESPSNIDTPCQRPTCKIPKLCRNLCTVPSPREHSPPTCSPCKTPPTSASALYGPPLSHKNVPVKKSLPSKKCTGSCCKQQPSQSSNVPSCSKCSPISSILNGKKLKSPPSQLPPSEPAPNKICQKESSPCKSPNKSLNEENSLHGQKSILKRTPSENCCKQRSASPKSPERNSPQFSQNCAEPATDNRKVCCKSSSSLNQLEKPDSSPKEQRSPQCSEIPYFPRDSPKRPQSPRCPSPQTLPEKPILRNGSPKVQSPCSSCCSTKSSASGGLPENSMSPLPSGISLKKAAAPVSPKPPTPPTPPKPKRKIFCDTPPCDTLKKLEDVEVFPWPTKNQVSNPPSPCPSPEPKKSGDKCKKDCSMKQLKSERPLQKNVSPNPSNKSGFPDPSCFPVLPDGEKTVLKLASTPRCSPYQVVSTPCPPKQDNMIACPPQQANSTPCPPKSKNIPECSAPDCSIQNSPHNEVSKMSGLHLKMKATVPVKKTCADDCPAWNEPLLVTMKDTPCNDILNSVKQETASDREVRGPRNIKVQDEDGVTLYERRDYDCMHSQDSAQSRNSVIEDLYKEPEINRIGTPLTVRNMEEDEDKKDLSSQISDKSLLNSVEIDFKLRITQGDKTTEIDIGNDDEKRALRTDLNQSRPEVFMINNGKADPTVEIPKNDINIKITLRNFKSKPKCKNGRDKKRTADFSKQISDKFHTVSTGYSDVEEENSFSIHRATINLASSPIISHESSNLHEPVPPCEVSSHSLDLVSDVTEDYKLDKTLSDKEDQVEKYIDIKESITPNYDEINDNLCAIEYSEPTLNETNTEKVTLINTNKIENNDDKIMSKVASKEQKKGLLKKVFQKAGSRTKNKENIRELRDMLKIILTDSSDNEETNISSNELAKDVTYTSLKPNYFRNTDSMNNYYEIDSNISSIRDSKLDSLYPTAEINSRTSRSSDTEDNEVAFKGCMCSAIAEKLNQLNGGQIGCCCRQNLRKDEETNCDIRNADDYFLLNYKTTEFVDVETQNSRRLTGTVNSYNVSIHSRSNRFSTTSENVKVIEDLKTPNKRGSSIAQGESVAYESRIETEHIKVEQIAIVSHIGKLSKHNCNNCFARSSEMKQLYQSSAETNDNLSVQIPPIDKSKKSFKRSRRNDRSEETIDGKDVLQSYAAKKAVLEIYAEKAENGDKFVAKLPKFVVERESEMTKNFEELASNSYKSMENVIVMSVER